VAQRGGKGGWKGRVQVQEEMEGRRTWDDDNVWLMLCHVFSQILHQSLIYAEELGGPKSQNNEPVTKEIECKRIFVIFS